MTTAQILNCEILPPESGQAWVGIFTAAMQQTNRLNAALCLQRSLTTAHMDRHLAAARLHRPHSAGRQVKGLQIGAAQRGRRHRLDGVQHRCAARHAAGVPVRELAAGDQDERVLGIGPLVSRDDAGRGPGRTCTWAIDRSSGCRPLGWLLRRRRAQFVQARKGDGLDLAGLTEKVHGLASEKSTNLAVRRARCPSAFCY